MSRVKGRKPLTKREKKVNREIKQEMIEKGIIPPDKPKLNRKKYIEEAREEFNNRDESCMIWELYLIKAAGFMLAQTERGSFSRASPEAVGVAKLLRLMLRMRQFDKELQEQGRGTYTFKEQYEYIKDILEA